MLILKDKEKSRRPSKEPNLRLHTLYTISPQIASNCGNVITVAKTCGKIKQSTG